MDGVTCHLSRAKTGGISGSFGIIKDKAEASITCRQIDPIKLTSNLRIENKFLENNILYLKLFRWLVFMLKKET